MTTNALLNTVGLIAILAVVFLIIYFISKNQSDSPELAKISPL